MSPTRRLLACALWILDAVACHHPSHVEPSDASGSFEFPTPIHRVIVVVKENHTFDNYFTGLPGADTVTTATFSNGLVITRPFIPDGGMPYGPCHSHDCAMTAFNDGGFDGFNLTASYVPDNLQFGRYQQTDLPAYWTYAQNFVVADHYFTTLAGPSTPNHLATIAAQSPIFDNPVCFFGCGTAPGCQATPNGTVVPVWDQDTCVEMGNQPPCFDIPSVVDAFPADLTWRGYGDVESMGIDSAFFLIQSIGGNKTITDAHIRPTSQFIADLMAGDIPNFVHVDSVPVADQEGPPGPVCPGNNYTVEFVNAIMQGPYWNETAILITWDDWGGWFDHVKPAAEFCANGTFFYPGFRVPLVIISPWAKHGYVLTTVSEHASIPRLVEELFNLPFMTARDPHARDGKVGSLLGAFDFTQTPQPPLILSAENCP